MEPPSQRVGFLGATFSGTDIASIRLRMAENYATDIRSGLWEISTAVREGDSGAPVLKDDNALVIGVVVRRKTTDLAIAVPLRMMVEFLETHAVTNLPDEISGRFVAAESPHADLISETLRTQPSSTASNFHIAGLTSVLWNRDPRPDLPADLAGCNLFYAALNRELGIYAGRLFMMSQNLQRSSSTSTPTRKAELGRSIFAAAEVEERQNEPERAGALYSVAAEVFREASTQSLAGSKGGAYLKTWFASVEDIDLSSGAEVTNFANVAYKPFPMDAPPGLGFTPEKSDSLAAILLDYQTSLRRAAKLLPHGLTAPIANQALIAAAWGTQVAQSPDLAAASYQAVGDMLAHIEKYGVASKAYAAAWQNGSITPRVLEDYGFTHSLDTNRTMTDPAALETEIDFAPPLDTETLRGVISTMHNPL